MGSREGDGGGVTSLEPANRTGFYMFFIVSYIVFCLFFPVLLVWIWHIFGKTFLGMV